MSDPVPFSTREDWLKQATSALISSLDPERWYRLVHVGGWTKFRTDARRLFLVYADYHFTDEELRWMFDHLSAEFAKFEQEHRRVS